MFPSNTTQKEEVNEATGALNISGQIHPTTLDTQGAIKSGFPCQLQHIYGCFVSQKQSTAAGARWQDLAFCTKGNLFETGRNRGCLSRFTQSPECCSVPNLLLFQESTLHAAARFVHKSSHQCIRNSSTSHHRAHVIRTKAL